MDIPIDGPSASYSGKVVLDDVKAQVIVKNEVLYLPQLEVDDTVTIGVFTPEVGEL